MILITGIAGFIGSHLAKRLIELNYDVIGVDNLSNYCENPKDFIFNPVNFIQYVQENDLNQFDVIFHLAASINVDESIEYPEVYFNNNAKGTFIFLEELRKQNFKGKFIYASSAEVYGNARHQVMDEGHPLDPLSPYAVSKLSAEQFCKNYAQLYGLDITVIRNFNTFGEYQRDGFYGGVIAKFKAQAKNNESITVYGSGEQMRDYMHVSQAVSGYILAMEQKLPTIINFGSGKPIRIIDIANHIAGKFNVPIIHTKSRPNEIMRLQADITRAMGYGYKVETDFWKHLEDYLNF